MRCDWYQATINDNIQNVIGILSNNLGGNLKIAQSGMMGYQKRAFLDDENGSTLSTILWDGRTESQQLPHAFATSENAPDFMNLVRDSWRDSHRVTRIDVCEDLQGSGLFEDMSAKLQEIAKSKRVKTSVAGDWLTPDSPDGRTLYVGSPSSPCRVRLYEKGKEIAKKAFHSRGWGTPEGFPIDWVRLELQCRPSKGVQREVSASLPLEEFWGFSAFSLEVADKLAGMNVPRVKPTKYTKNADDAVLDFMVKQYGNVLMRKFKSTGSWEAVGAFLGEIYQGQRKFAAK